MFFSFVTNIFRGNLGAQWGIERAEADNIGMLGTIVNSLMRRGVLTAKANSPVEVRVMSAIPVNTVAEPYIRRRAIRHLEKDRVVLFASGTGNPYMTTDTAAALRAIEIDASVLLMAKHNVDGVYASDPRKNPDAAKYDSITYLEALEKRLGVMDSTALSLCMENSLPIIVFNLFIPGSAEKIVAGERLGSMVTAEPER